MNLKTVGLDYLPNILIEKIIISSDDSLEIFFCLYDHTGVRSWYDREVEAHTIKAHFVLLESEDDINNINSGLTKVSSYEEKEEIEISAPTIISVSPLYDKFLIRSVVTLGKKLIEYSSLNVYVSCYVDGFNFEDTALNIVEGPVFAERIITNGELVTESGFFYLENSPEDYVGPVHIHPSSDENSTIYMEGGEHSQTAHSKAFYVPEENFKIIDLRT
jgi:hypothetical protein